jgi:uncharacterized protein (TIGR02284 family)
MPAIGSPDGTVASWPSRAQGLRDGEASCEAPRGRHEACTYETVNMMKTASLWATYSPEARGAALSALREIVDACRDGENGYGQAAQDVQDPRLKELFSIYSNQRRGFADAIERQFIALGGTPRQGKTLSGRIHRKWLEVRATIDHGGAVSMLAECERGENTARAKYEHALSIPMPDYLRDILLDQLAEIRLAHDQLDRMRGR